MKRSIALIAFAALTGLLLLGWLIGGCSDNARIQNPVSPSEQVTLVGPKEKYDTPMISCGIATQTSIEIKVCAGATGAPAGFSLQWMTAADYAANGYEWDDSLLCWGSFSGKAHKSRYNLGPYGCVIVNIGDFLWDNGASTNCDYPLVCGTKYVFRAFAHGDNINKRSDFTADLYCRTLPCPGENCTFTIGYWKTHGPAGCNPPGHENLWPVTELTLGSRIYSDLQLCSILNEPVAGNGLISLAHQLIGAKLNIANGADDSAVADSVIAADALIDGLVVPPVGNGFLEPGLTSGLTDFLTDYNEGKIGPGRCDQDFSQVIRGLGRKD